MSHLSDFRKCRQLIKFQRKVPYLRLISLWIIEIMQCIFTTHSKTMNKKDVHAKTMNKKDVHAKTMNKKDVHA